MAKTEEALKNLKAAYKILKDEERWTQGTLASVPIYDDGDDAKEILDWDRRNEDLTGIDDPNAKFCALGAIQHVDGPGEKLAEEFLIQAATEICLEQDQTVSEDQDDVFTVNDEIGYDETLDMFERAIKLAKTKLKKVAKKAKNGKT